MASYGEVLVGTIPEDAFLLDVREDDEWAAGHAPAATHVALSTIPQHLASIPSDQTIAVICKAGGRSAQAADFLAAQGYTALNVKGGMLAWQRAGLPMVAIMLANNEIGDEVVKRGMLYAPDYAVNAGGVMNVALELDGYNRERAMRMMRTIYHNLARIYEISERDGIPTYRAADRLAEERIDAIGKLKLPLGRGHTRFQGRIRGNH